MTTSRSSSVPSTAHPEPTVVTTGAAARPSLERLKALAAVAESLMQAADLNQDEENVKLYGELVDTLDWVITEITNRRFRYRKQWAKRAMLAQVAKEKLSPDELRQVDEAASNLAARLTEKEEDDAESE